MTTKFDELVAKLKEIFQIDKPELDFGIYKILHARAAEINDFLEHKLKVQVEAVLRSHGQQDTKSALDTAKNELLQNVGADALETDGSVKQQYKALPIPAVKNAVENYEAALSAYQAAADSLKNETEVYSHLLEFFKRYYEEGDFVSKRRYKDGVYAIPYSGEEVKLHWANADQYYTKSGENFTNYRFTLEGGLKVEFKLISAETGKDNIKDNEAVRRFVLWNPEALADAELPEDGPELPSKAVEEKDGTLEIYFQYLKIAKPKKGEAKKVTKEYFAGEAEKAISDAIIADTTLKTKYQCLLAPVSKADTRTWLRKHLADYMEKNTSDYFIHKDLKGFLERELDYYVKTEMFKLDRIDEAATVKDIETNLHVIQAFRSIALVLIGFMAQLENFQKKLWLKKKFVTSCEYCITMDRIPDELKPEVLANKAQLEEWKTYGIDVDPRTIDEHAIDARMVDTRHFSEEFKAKLLLDKTDLDDQCDGLLIHSDNFQALNLLRERYYGRVKCVYVDPPYNTGDSEILYKNSYLHSSWLSLMEGRLMASKALLSNEYAYFIAIDDFEMVPLCQMVDDKLGAKRAMVIVNHHPQGGKAKILANTHEYMLALVPQDSDIVLQGRPKEDGGEEEIIEERSYMRSGTANSNFRAHREGSFYAFLVDPKSLKVVGLEKPPQLGVPYPKEDTPEGYKRIYPIGGGNVERVWRNYYHTAKRMLAAGKFIVTKKFVIKQVIRADEKNTALFSNWVDKRYNAGSNGASLLEDIMGEQLFGYPKSLYTVMDAIGSVKDIEDGDIILDYFGGSGTTAQAVIALNSKDTSVSRKYLLVEMGDHFDTVLMPRIKKVVYSPEWKDGKPKMCEKGISHCFKYMTLESYEDALNNIELKRTAEQESMLPGLNDDKYLLKYFLDVESRGSIISTDDFQKPFDYELKIAYESSGAAKPQKIDLVETFNYLIGLKVDSYVRRIDKGYCYLDGILPSGEHALVFWRDCDKLDAKALNDELEKLGVDAATKKATFDVIYVNGDHAVQNGRIKPAEGAAQLKVRQIETEFLEKMFACEEV